MELVEVRDEMLAFFLLLLVIGIALIFFRAIRGPRFTDRIVAVNYIGTMATVFICIQSVYLDIPFFIDVALTFALLNFLTVIVICRVVTLHYKGRQLNLEHKKESEQI
ncbi:MAG: monovalent cation/H+ antiporter complex subunit F [Bacillota bacterium]